MHVKTVEFLIFRNFPFSKECNYWTPISLRLVVNTFYLSKKKI